MKRTHMSTGYSVALSVTTLTLLALVSALFAAETADSTYTMPQAVLTQASGEETVVVLPSVGQGTTNPPAGNYTLPHQAAFTLTAVSADGYHLQFWVINSYVPPQGTATPNSGYNTTTPTSNPLTIQGKNGYTYYYVQAMFQPDDETTDKLSLGWNVTAAMAFLVGVAVAEAFFLGYLFVKKVKPNWKG